MNNHFKTLLFSAVLAVAFSSCKSYGDSTSQTQDADVEVTGIPQEKDSVLAIIEKVNKHWQ
ncbi:MAG: glycoside hydrolase family 88 protein, partial [Bacteroidota bacterium]|nr:glycoside hydrolase family 88 protein [Bacteroidota bacterium]